MAKRETLGDDPLGTLIPTQQDSKAARQEDSKAGRQQAAKTVRRDDSKTGSRQDSMTASQQDGTPRKKMTVYIDPDLHRRAKGKAVLEDKSLSEVVAALLTQYVED